MQHREVVSTSLFILLPYSVSRFVPRVVPFFFLSIFFFSPLFVFFLILQDDNNNNNRIFFTCNDTGGGGQTYSRGNQSRDLKKYNTRIFLPKMSDNRDFTLVVSECLVNDSAARPNNDDVRSERSAFLPWHQVSRHPRVFRTLLSVPWGPAKKQIDASISDSIGGRRDGSIETPKSFETRPTFSTNSREIRLKLAMDSSEVET